jgi:hypothetical protein
MNMDIPDFVGWIVIGAAIGFWYSTKHTKAGFQTAVLKGVVPKDPIRTRRLVSKYLVGYRLGWITVFTLLGAVAGAVFFLLLSLLVKFVK